MVRLSLCGVARKGSLYLLGKRKPGGSQGGLWEFPGGKAENNETPQEALAREFMEELGVQISVGEQPIYIGSFFNGEKEYRLEAYGVEFAEDVLTSIEHDELRWVDLDTMERLNLSDSDRQVQRYLKTAK